MARECGTCNACCVYPAVPAINKPAGEPCRFLTAAGHGCQVYAGRPAMCRAYSCAWIEGHGKEDDQPSEIGVLVDRRDSQFGNVLIARALRPGAAQERKAVRAIKRISADAGLVCLVVADNITENERVVQIIGDDKLMNKFKSQHPDVRVCDDGSAKKLPVVP